MEPTPNLPALRKTWEWIQTETELPPPVRSWHQTVWHVTRDRDEDFFAEWDRQAEALRIDLRNCGTAMCFAGHVADTAGVQWTDGDSITVDDRVRQLIGDEVLDDMGVGRYFPLRVEAFAATYLGLTDDEADDLFAGHNDASDIRDALERIFARAGEKL